MIEELTIDHTMEVYDLLRPFYDEGHWKEYGQFSSDNTVKYIMSFLSYRGKTFAGRDDKGLTGLLSVQIDYEFHVQPVAYITNFYTSPRARGTVLARGLFGAAVNYCEEEKTVAQYVGNCGIFTAEADKVFGNLVKKFGFCELSTMYGRF